MTADSLNITVPTLYEGSLAVDDRGEVRFVNKFDLAPHEFRRFYLVSNHQPLPIRAWHAHKYEVKAVTLVRGAAIVAAVKIDDWTRPNPLAEVSRFVLSANKPSVLLIPAGYANGFRCLTPDASLLWFSSLTVEESQRDDYRFGAHFWEPWEVVAR